YTVFYVGITMCVRASCSHLLPRNLRGMGNNTTVLGHFVCTGRISRSCRMRLSSGRCVRTTVRFHGGDLVLQGLCVAPAPVRRSRNGFSNCRLIHRCRPGSMYFLGWEWFLAPDYITGCRPGVLFPLRFHRENDHLIPSISGNLLQEGLPTGRCMRL